MGNYYVFSVVFQHPWLMYYQNLGYLKKLPKSNIILDKALRISEVQEPCWFGLSKAWGSRKKKYGRG